MWVSSPSTYFSKHAYTYCGQWFVNLVFACIFCILNLPIAQAITPILEEDFQSGQVNSHPLAGNNNTSILFIRDSGPGRSLLVAGSVDYTQPLGLFGQSNNRGLHFYAGSDSQDDSPSLFLQSSHLAEFIGSVGLSYQLTHPSPSNTPALKIIIGEDLSGNQALASGNNDEALAQIDVRARFQGDGGLGFNSLRDRQALFLNCQRNFQQPRCHDIRPCDSYYKASRVPLSVAGTHLMHRVSRGRRSWGFVVHYIITVTHSIIP